MTCQDTFKRNIQSPHNNSQETDPKLNFSTDIPRQLSARNLLAHKFGPYTTAKNLIEIEN